MKSSKELLPQLLEANSLCHETIFIIPIFFIHGKYDYQVSRELVTTFFNQMDCPKKSMIIFNQSAHFPNVEEPKKFEQIINAFSNEIIPQNLIN